MHTNKIIDELYICSAVCDACYKGCLAESDRDYLQHCMMLDKECLEICRLTGSLLEEDSENTDKFLSLCSDICVACAEECEKHNYEHCRACAKECRKCSEICMEFQVHIDT